MNPRTRTACVSLLLLLFSGPGRHGEAEGAIVGWGQRVILEPSAFDGIVAADGGWKHSVALGPNGSSWPGGTIPTVSAVSPSRTSDSWRSRPTAITPWRSGLTARSCSGEETIHLAVPELGLRSCCHRVEFRPRLEVRRPGLGLGIQPPGVSIAQHGLRRDRRGVRSLSGAQVRRIDRRVGEQSVRAVQRALAEQRVRGDCGGGDRQPRSQGGRLDCGVGVQSVATCRSRTRGSSRWSAAMFMCLALRADGSIAAWGGNSEGQCDVPEPNEGFVAIGAGVITALGSEVMVPWSGGARVGFSQSYVPDPHPHIVAISAKE